MCIPRSLLHNYYLNVSSCVLSYLCILLVTQGFIIFQLCIHILLFIVLSFVIRNYLIHLTEIHVNGTL